ncbi:MAG: hypothetical protein ACFFDB_00220 [Promethearchaeota archaeon]
MGTKKLPKNHITLIGKKVANIMLAKKIPGLEAVNIWENTEMTDSYKKYDIEAAKDEIADAAEQVIIYCYNQICQEDKTESEPTTKEEKPKTTPKPKKGKSGTIAPILNVELLRGKIGVLQDRIGNQLLERLKKRTKVEVDCGDEAEVRYVGGNKVGCFYK